MIIENFGGYESIANSLNTCLINGIKDFDNYGIYSESSEQHQ